MILIDLGNTNAKVYHNNDQPIKLASDCLVEYLKDYQEQHILICSVVPRIAKQVAQAYPQIEFINSDNYHLMFDNSELLTTKGADRIIAGYGALCKYGPKVVVCDIGSCVTLDTIDNRQYIQGFIYPGFAMLENLLSEKIEQLPKPQSGRTLINTENQIYGANIYGFIGALHKLIEQSIPTSDYQLVITGGSVLKLKEEYDVDLLQELKQFKPSFEPHLIKNGLDQYRKIKL